MKWTHIMLFRKITAFKSCLSVWSDDHGGSEIPKITTGKTSQARHKENFSAHCSS